MSSSFSRQCDSWNFVTSFFHYIFRYESFLFLAFLPLLRPLTFFKVSVVQEFQPAVHQIRLLGLSLGPDLPWADEPSPGNLRFSAKKILTSFFVYSYRHSHFLALQHSLRYTFAAARNAPLPIVLLQSLDFGGVLEPRYIFGAGALDQ